MVLRPAVKKLRPTTGLYCLIVMMVLSLGSCASIPDNVTVLSDRAYGSHERQTLDVYTVAGNHDAPVIFMVHGGGWRRGDKAAGSVVEHKVTRWVNRGVVFISSNYRLTPDADPLQQAEDVAEALAYAQRNAGRWGASADKFVLMGHSAGAHLVSLLNADPSIADRHGVKPWLGTVAIDSAGFDIDRVMRSEHVLRLYQKAFGDDPAYWRRASPLHQLHSKQPPLLAICSEVRKDNPCRDARAFAEKARTVGMRVDLLPQDLSHRQANLQLGEDNNYTREVEAFLASLDTAFSTRLRR